MWDLPGPGLEPVSPPLAGGFLTTAPPGKPYTILYKGVWYPWESWNQTQGQLYSSGSLLPGAGFIHSSSFHFVAPPSSRLQGHWLDPLYLLSEEKRDYCRGGFHGPALEGHMLPSLLFHWAEPNHLVTTNCPGIWEMWSSWAPRRKGRAHSNLYHIS